MIKKFTPQLFVALILFLGAIGWTWLVYFQAPPASSVPRSTASFDAARPVHDFSPALLERVVRPKRAAGDGLLQNAVVPRRAIADVYKALDPSLPLAWQMEMKYGLYEHTTSYYPDVPSTFAQYKTEKMGVAPNCFACHSSRLEDKMIIGLGNTRIDLGAFFEDLVPKKHPLHALHDTPALLKNLEPIFTKIDDVPWSLKRSFKGIEGDAEKVAVRTAMLLSMFKFVIDPANQSNTAGHSNPWSFAVQLFKWRDNNMDYLDTSFNGRGFKLDSVVLDPMPWWLLKYKNYINWDSIIKKSHRSIVQAVLAPGKSGAEVREMEPFYKEIFEEAERIQPPIYPRIAQLNPAFVAQGEKLFNAQCAECHGTHSVNGEYFRDPDVFKKTFPEKIYSVEEIGTDPKRVQTINVEYLKQLQASWMGFYNSPEYSFRMQTLGYVAPPLWGIWASAPYFHNGSVPNLYAVLFPESRPERWKIVEPKTQTTPYDYDKIGLVVIENPKADLQDRKLYDTTLHDGRSKDGHEKSFEKLDRAEKLSLLEYMKTL